MREILDHIIRTLAVGPVVLAAIVRSSGSAPRTSGAWMLVRADGSLAGSVGGGGLEGACVKAAADLYHHSEGYRVLEFHLDALAAAAGGMICGGTAAVLLQRLEPTSLAFFERLRSDYLAGRRPLLGVFLPTAEQGPRLLQLDDTALVSLSEGLRREILTKAGRESFLAGEPGAEVFISPLVHPGTVHLIGAGHVALATAPLACFVGFEVVVVDDRAEFANRERYPEVREVRVLTDFSTCFNQLGADDYVIIVTRGHLHDRDVLAQALRTDAGYIGMIGSRGTRQAVYASLREAGYTDDDLARVHCPIGMAIGADTPAEIGVSIVAELIQVRAGKR